MATPPNYADSRVVAGLPSVTPSPLDGQQLDPTKAYVPLAVVSTSKDVGGTNPQQSVLLSDLIAYIAAVTKGQ